MRNIDHIIIHCSATQAKVDVDAIMIDGWHRARGWFGNGYHYVIKRNGTLESHALGNRCRPLNKPGAHVGDCGTGWNARSIGICLAGGVAEDGKTAENNFTEEQFSTLRDLLRVLEGEFPLVQIMGHRDLIEKTGAPPKACPSFDVAKWLEDNDI